MRKITIVLGILLAAGAFVGYVVMGTIMNPSPYRVVVIIRDVPSGTVLSRDMVGIDPQRVSPRVAAEYVQEKDLPRVLGRIAARDLYPGQPLMWYDVVTEDNPRADKFPSLGQADPSMAVVRLPVDKRMPPPRPGDKVAIISAWGNLGMDMGGYVPGTEMLQQTGEYSPTVSVPGIGQVPPEVAALMAPQVVQETQASSRPQMPIVKVVAYGTVVRVVHEKEMNPAYTGQPGESAYIYGEPLFVDVSLRRELVEAALLAAVSDSYSMAILSPQVPAESLEGLSTWGADWRDMDTFYEMERLRKMGVVNVPGLQLPGAYEMYGDFVRQWRQARALGSLGVPITATGGISLPLSTGMPFLPGMVPVLPGQPGTGLQPGQSGGEAVTPTIEGQVSTEGAAVTPTPFVPPPLPTATPIAPTPTPVSSPSTLGLGIGNILMGVGCLGLFVIVIVAGFLLVRRKK